VAGELEEIGQKRRRDREKEGKEMVEESGQGL
jgi:hypothetical protein